MCIGNNFAMYEMMMAVSQVVSNYSIQSVGDSIGITPLITLKPKGAILKFIKR